jgi:phenylpropionate dioxygenase-like ring-hydroxylating dioxygenase large terminal subunit
MRAEESRMTTDRLTDAFFADMASSVLGIERAETLPPAVYTSPAFFEFERDAVFRREWLCVGRVSWVSKPGEYFTTTIAGEPILVVRNRDGALKAMSPVCRHRAMWVAEGHGTASSFLCPYHHWCYALDGGLISAPAMERTEDFDLGQIRLPSFQVEVWLGFVFVNLDPNAPPLGPRLSALTEALAHYDLEAAEGPRPGPSAQFPWNWKVMMENNNDGYHANKLHHGPLHDFVPSALSVFPELPADTAGYFRFNGTTHPDASFNATQRAVLPVFPRLTEPERNRMMFANVPPTLSLVLTSDIAIYIILRADSVDRVETDRGVLLAPGAMREPGFEHRLALYQNAGAAIAAQDQHVDALVQQGLRSHFAPRGRYSWQEGAQSAFNRWLVERYQAGWRRLGWGPGAPPGDPHPAHT